MQHPYLQIKKITFGLLAPGLLSGWLAAAHAAPYPGPSQGTCDTGYTNILTTPADVPRGFTVAQVQEKKLPDNVCVRWKFEQTIHINENFSPSDFVIVTPTLTKSHFNVDAYEPIVGHYVQAGRNYVASAEPRSSHYNDFTGKHPIFISKTAKAIVRFAGGKYYIDKQIQIRGSEKSTCPHGFSTVGESATCYSKDNGLKLNTDNKLELVELGTFVKRHSLQECPLGYSTATGLGSYNGICTSTLALKNGVAKTELWNPWAIGNVTCKQGEYTENNLYCLPALTAVYCGINEATQRKLTSYKYSLGRHVFYWPTKKVNLNNAKVDFNTFAGNTTNGVLSVSSVRQGLSLFDYDKAFVSLSGLDGLLPAFRLYTEQQCDGFQITGAKRIDPLPTFE